MIVDVLSALTDRKDGIEGSHKTALVGQYAKCETMYYPLSNSVSREKNLSFSKE
jgi:hypothetical protein